MDFLKTLAIALLTFYSIYCDKRCFQIRQKILRKRLNTSITPYPGSFVRSGHPNEFYNQSVGSKVSFTCNSITFTSKKPDLAPFSKLKWFHDGKEINTTNEKVKKKLSVIDPVFFKLSQIYGCRKIPFITGTRLTLFQLAQKDAGNYTCGLWLENSTDNDLSKSLFFMSFKLDIYDVILSRGSQETVNFTQDVIHNVVDQPRFWICLLTGFVFLVLVVFSLAKSYCKILKNFHNIQHIPKVEWKRQCDSGIGATTQAGVYDDQIQKRVEYINDKYYHHLFPFISEVEWEMLRKNQVDRSSVTCEVEFSMPIVLGTGNFGHVYMGEITLRNGSKRKIAVKRLNDGYKPKELGHFLMEAVTLIKAGKHCNVISIIGSILLDTFTEDENVLKKPPILLMELASGGNLKTFLEERRVSKEEINVWEEGKLHALVGKNITYKDLTSFCYQISRGMEHLSSKKIIHRDLAARNVLLTDDKIIKIADFGLSKHIRGLQSEYYRMHSPSLAPAKWTAPESLLENKFSMKSDVWSYGVLAWEIFTMGCQPYQHIPVAQLYRRLSSGIRLEKPEFADRKTYNLMKRCWGWDPENRPNFSELPYVELNEGTNSDFTVTNSETYVTMNSDVETDSMFGYNESLTSTIPLHAFDKACFSISMESNISKWTLDSRQEFVQLLNPIYEENNSLINNTKNSDGKVF